MQKCPKCGTDSHVIDSRPYGGTVRRRRLCGNDDCRVRWSTYEMSAEDYQALKRVPDALAAARKELRKCENAVVVNPRLVATEKEAW